MIGYRLNRWRKIATFKNININKMNVLVHELHIFIDTASRQYQVPDSYVLHRRQRTNVTEYRLEKLFCGTYSVFYA